MSKWLIRLATERAHGHLVYGLKFVGQNNPILYYTIRVQMNTNKQNECSISHVYAFVHRHVLKVSTWIQ